MKTYKKHLPIFGQLPHMDREVEDDEVNGTSNLEEKN